ALGNQLRSGMKSLRSPLPVESSEPFQVSFCSLTAQFIDQCRYIFLRKKRRRVCTRDRDLSDDQQDQQKTHDSPPRDWPERPARYAKLGRNPSIGASRQGMRGLLRWLITLYKTYVSPYKGFHCAYRVNTGRLSCSSYAYRVLERRDSRTA